MNIFAHSPPLEPNIGDSDEFLWQIGIPEEVQHV